MELPSYFADFLSDIRPTQDQKNDCVTGHTTLRDRLDADDNLSDVLIATFLQGSYRRATAVRPDSGKRLDVDVVVVTSIDVDTTTPKDAIARFVPFVKKHYEGKYHLAGRSIGINLSYVDLDLVVTAIPGEAARATFSKAALATSDTLEDLISMSGFGKMLETASTDQDWKDSPLWIPDRDAGQWQRTHPLAQISWTWAKNRACGGHYVNVVKALKWWRRVNHPTPKYPKSYPLEHIIGECCPDRIESVGEGVARTLEGIRDRFAIDIALRQVPFLPDRGVAEHNVLKRIAAEEFAEFHQQCSDAADVARQALEADTVVESAATWRQLLGEEFPEPPGTGSKITTCGKSGGFSPRTDNTKLGTTRFA